jgi:hypothetical protein
VKSYRISLPKEEFFKLQNSDPVSWIVQFVWIDFEFGYIQTKWMDEEELLMLKLTYPDLRVIKETEKIKI